MKHPKEYSFNDMLSLIAGVILTGLGIYLLLDIAFGVLSLMVGSYLLRSYIRKMQ